MSDFTIQVDRIGIVSFNAIEGATGDTFEIYGNTRVDGETYPLIRVYGHLRRFDLFAAPLREEFLFPVTPDGTLSPDIPFFWQTGYPPYFLAAPENAKFGVVPENARFDLVERKTESAASSKGSTNFEILFSGVDRDSIRLTYREYTPSDLARPAFSQDLTFLREEGSIQFRNIVIRVVNVSNRAIEFVVLED